MRILYDEKPSDAFYFSQRPAPGEDRGGVFFTSLSPLKLLQTCRGDNQDRTTKNVSYSVRPSPPSGILTTATLGTLGRRAACSAAALALERGLELGGDLVATRIGSKSEAAPGHAPA